MRKQPNQPGFRPAAAGYQSGWHWGTFLVFCVMLVFTGWLCGFLIPRWVAMIMGGAIGLVAGMCHWFDDEYEYRPDHTL